jgi:hypothetical protein
VLIACFLDNYACLDQHWELLRHSGVAGNLLEP